MVWYKVSVIHSDGTRETKKLFMSCNSEAAEAEAECYFEDIQSIDIERLWASYPA